MSYAKSAPTAYDLIYTHMKNYEAETARLLAIASACGSRGGRRWLNIGCGTGLHDQYLTNEYDLTGLDLSEDMLVVARARLPQVPYMTGNMVNFDLGQTFDVVSCLFSAIGHIAPDELDSTIRSMARHMAPGGVLIIEPWIMPDQWRDGYTEMRVVETPEIKISRGAHSTRTGCQTTLNFGYTIVTATGVEQFEESHTCTMFTEGEYLAAFTAAGLNGRFDPRGISANGRGVFVATLLSS